MTADRTRPDTELRELLPRVTCASLVDALAARRAHPAHVLDLVSPTPGAVLFGRAVTMRLIPTRRDIQDAVGNDFASLFYRAIPDGGQGRVLVMSSGGHPEVALGGGRKLARLERNGLAGLLADGRLRDFEGLAGYRFTAYCRGETTRQGGAFVMPHEVNVPVEFAGVTVLPGDYVYADRSGAVAIPAVDVADVLAEAARLEELDRASVERSRTEDPARVIAEGDAR